MPRRVAAYTARHPAAIGYGAARSRRCAEDGPIRRDAALSRLDLSRLDLSAADLSGADFSGADFSGADLFEANLILADTKDTDKSDC